MNSILGGSCEGWLVQPLPATTAGLLHMNTRGMGYRRLILTNLGECALREGEET